MATPLDTGLLNVFEGVFPFLFVLVVVWVVLLRVKPFSDNKFFAVLIAFLFALVTMFSPIAIKTINKMAPWFVLLFIAIVFVLIVYQAFGIPESSIIGVITGSEHGTDFAWTMLSIILFIILGSLFTVLSEEKITLRPIENVSLEEQSAGAWFVGVLTHPKVLGFMVIMLIAMFTLQRLVASEGK